MASTSVVKFPFEKHNPKDLLVELELFDKLLPPSNSKTSQNVAQINMRCREGDGDYSAKVNVTTSLSLNRELQLVAGEFMQHELVPESRLWFLCQAGALNRAALQPQTVVHLATHTLVDSRDGARYMVQIVHSASLLLSIILVYGREQRLLCMAHLVGADSLPSRDQLDPNLQFLPHLSTPDERAFVILNKDGDYAIVKGRWTGFTRKMHAEKGQKAKPGNPGKLQVDAFNLLKNTVQKLEVPGPEGSTLFVIGDAQARLPGKRIQCRSTLTAEHLACVFSVATLFVLCNPDKVRSRSDTTVVGYQCHKWPLTLACGYGKALPSNRYLATKQGVEGVDVTSAMVLLCGGGYDGAACGACGACGELFLALERAVLVVDAEAAAAAEVAVAVVKGIFMTTQKPLADFKISANVTKRTTKEVAGNG
ncbi:unnamed protein product [Toxocara canis]|uniref:Nucleoporin_N domain-containing protein n=1 Tax=Toxocara canis TaxID=6265 RepID=A0A183TWK5_TOXCA|nr:unnamed protein product [Toxocara canis]